MTKVEDCTWEVETAASDMSSAESGTRYENARKRLVESIKDLIQAVQDEERSKTCPVCAGLPPVESISELIWKCDKCGSELLSIFYQRLSPVLFPFPLRDLPAGGEVPKEEVKE